LIYSWGPPTPPVDGVSRNDVRDERRVAVVTPVAPVAGCCSHADLFHLCMFILEYWSYCGAKTTHAKQLVPQQCQLVADGRSSTNSIGSTLYIRDLAIDARRARARGHMAVCPEVTACPACRTSAYRAHITANLPKVIRHCDRPWSNRVPVCSPAGPFLPSFPLAPLRDRRRGTAMSGLIAAGRDWRAVENPVRAAIDPFRLRYQQGIL
jgi:hypothetical protein